MAFSIKIGDASVLNLDRFWYEYTLNGIRNFEIVTDANDSTLRSEYSVDNVVEIYRDGTLDFKGKVGKAGNYQSGGIILRGIGQEKELADEKCPVDAGKNTKTWTSTSSNTIFNTLVTTASGWTTDTSGATSVTLDSFRVSKSLSVWNGMIQLLKHINKDFYIDDAAKKVYLVDKKNRTEKAVFNEGINCGQVRWTEESVKASKVEVYGKGDGDNQIIGSAGSGTPVFEVIDRNIISDTEADTRAQKELDLIQNSVKHYFFDANNPNEDIELGDTVKLNANSAGLHDVGIDVVRFTRGMQGDSETLTLEVTNPQYRRASKSLYANIAKSESDSNTSRSSMQGSGNLSQWGRGINANNSVALKVNFEVSSAYFQDEAGNLRIGAMTLDYDVDKYNEQYGGATFTGSDPQVQNLSGDTQPTMSGDTGDEDPVVRGSSATSTPAAQSGDLSFSTNVEGVAVNNTMARCKLFETLVGTPSFAFGRAAVTLLNVTGAAVNVTPKYSTSGGAAGTLATNYNLANNAYWGSEGGNSTESNWVDNIWFRVWDDNYNTSYWWGTANLVYSHTHGSHDHGYGGYYAINHDHTSSGLIVQDHDHPNGDYDINAADLNHISIGDGIGESSSINASQVSIYLDYWDDKAITNNETAGADVVIEMADTGNISVGDIVYFNGTNKEWATVSAVTIDTSITATITSNKTAGDKITWVNKHSILNTGKTIDTGVDIRDSATYPDAIGYWRVRIFTDNATPDFLQGAVSITHELDN